MPPALSVIGPEGVERHDQAGERQLRHHRDADAVDARQLVRDQDAERQQDRGRRGGLEALREPLDDVGRVACLRRPCRGAHRPEAGGRVVVGDHEQPGRDAHAHEGAEPEVEAARRVGAGAQQLGHVVLVRDVVHQEQRDRQERQGREAAGHDQALVERALDVPGLAAHGVGADDRGEDRDAAEDQRVDRHGADLVEGQHAEQHHRHRGDRVGLEEVGGHAGAVADVVAHVVGDHRRVARVVLGDPGLDLAHQVGAHVGRLGEDAAAQTGEHGDQRAAEAEAHEGVDRVALLGAGQDQDPVVARPPRRGRARPRACR